MLMDKTASTSPSLAQEISVAAKLTTRTSKSEADITYVDNIDILATTRCGRTDRPTSNLGP